MRDSVALTAKADAKTAAIVARGLTQTDMHTDRSGETAELFDPSSRYPPFEFSGCSFGCLQDNKAGIVLEPAANMLPGRAD